MPYHAATSLGCRGFPNHAASNGPNCRLVTAYRRMPKYPEPSLRLPMQQPQDIFSKDSYFSFEAENKFEGTADSDALRAVKLDPAVLEAQLTVDTRNQVEVASNSSRTSETKAVFRDSFESMMLKQEAALLSLTPTQFDLLMKFTDTLRQQRHSIQKQLECVFCKNNGEPLSWYSTHSLKDSRGRVRCPVLRVYRCPRCGACGDWAHTIKYCPKNIAGLTTFGPAATLQPRLPVTNGKM